MSYINLHTNSMDGNGNIISAGMFSDWQPNSGDILSTYYVSGIVPVQLKMFVPPGTLSVTVTYNCQYNTMYLTDITDAGRMAICWGDEISTEPVYSPPSTYSGELVPGLEVVVSQDGTNMSVVLSAGDTGLTSGEWLYIWVVNNDSDTSHKQYISAYVTVDMEAYSEWYYKASWDEEGNPTTFGSTLPVSYPHIDPYLDILSSSPTAEYPQPWPIPYPWSQPFPYPFGE